MKNKKVFISYSWDNESHKKWVQKLSDDLCAIRGITTILDQKDLVLGDLIPLFMERAISESDYVLFVCTPQYKEKADNRMGGVGYEDSIITGELYRKNNRRKYIPVLAVGEWSTALPVWASGQNGIAMRTKDEYDTQLPILISTILAGKK